MWYVMWLFNGIKDEEGVVNAIKRMAIKPREEVTRVTLLIRVLIRVLIIINTDLRMRCPNPEVTKEEQKNLTLKCQRPCRSRERILMNTRNI